MNYKTFIFIGLLLGSVQAWAGSVSIPNTFINGTTASADEVNANFDAVETAVNDNDTRIGNIRSINVYVDGIRRGALIDSLGGNFIDARAFRVLLDSGYYVLLSTAGDGLFRVPLKYESTNCTGQAYFTFAFINPVAARQGFVISNDTPALGTLYYVQAGTVIENIAIESTTQGGVCNTVVPTPVEATKILVNDSALTGVTHSDFVGEVTVGF